MAACKPAIWALSRSVIGSPFVRIVRSVPPLLALPDLTWNPHLYLTFGAERTRPAADLVARIDVPEAKLITDLGCGPGNSTALLRARWPAASITGLDSDPAMLAAAARADGAVRWVKGDAARWEPGRLQDVVFSNAMLQWIGDHAAAIERWLGALAPGGALAVQLPSPMWSRIRLDILAVADEARWRDATQGARDAIVVHEPAWYYDLLGVKAERVDLWETEYVHVMEGPEAILTWVRGTALRPFLDALGSAEDRGRFEASLLERVEASFPRRRDGKVLFPFRRLFFVAYRARA